MSTNRRTVTVKLAINILASDILIIAIILLIRIKIPCDCSNSRHSPKQPRLESDNIVVSGRILTISAA